MDAIPSGPSLAVVVPTLDEAGHLPALLASLGWHLEHGGEDADPGRADHVIVADGGSRDGTREIAAAHGVEVVSAPRGRGPQLAAGARRAQGEVLLFLHADARVGPGALEHLRAAFRRTGLVAAGMRQRIDAAGWFYRSVERAANRRVRRGWVYGDSGLAVLRAEYDAVGGYSELPIFEDVDLSRRLRERGAIALVEDAELVISARRWQAEGPFLRTGKNWLLTAAYRLGVPPARLARHYRPRRGVEIERGGAA